MEFPKFKENISAFLQNIHNAIPGSAVMEGQAFRDKVKRLLEESGTSDVSSFCYWTIYHAKELWKSKIAPYSLSMEDEYTELEILVADALVELKTRVYVHDTNSKKEIKLRNHSPTLPTFKSTSTDNIKEVNALATTSLLSERCWQCNYLPLPSSEAADIYWLRINSQKSEATCKNSFEANSKSTSGHQETFCRTCSADFLKELDEQKVNQSFHNITSYKVTLVENEMPEDDLELIIRKTDKNNATICLCGEESDSMIHDSAVESQSLEDDSGITLEVVLGEEVELITSKYHSLTSSMKYVF